MRLLKSLENLKKHVIDHNIVPIDHNIIPWVQNCSLTRSGSIDITYKKYLLNLNLSVWRSRNALGPVVSANQFVAIFNNREYKAFNVGQDFQMNSKMRYTYTYT